MELALQQINAHSRNIPLVIFGHMRESLRGHLTPAICGQHVPQMALLKHYNSAKPECVIACPGDHGDRDLELALQQIWAQGRHVPLVVFGHMHEKLRGTLQLRNMVEVDAATGTVYLNTAVVPRIRTKVISGQEVCTNLICWCTHVFMIPA